LSRFAGAASECTAALLVKPYDPDAVATSIAHALSMTLEERRTLRPSNHPSHFKPPPEGQVGTSSAHRSKVAASPGRRVF
jgi:hypothetical protein